MQRHLAFLRAINVGGRRVKMDELSELVEGAGLTNVDTYLASGNVIFDADGDGDDLERTLANHLEAVIAVRLTRSHLAYRRPVE